jgi:hypothetical protein
MMGRACRMLRWRDFLEVQNALCHFFSSFAPRPIF